MERFKEDVLKRSNTTPESRNLFGVTKEGQTQTMSNFFKPRYSTDVNY
ncbi:hypothetical protein SynMINOS11_00054 [Synechococcus sp. Minos11]|nr:hypothetical protein SynMINOS11_00054 [Synechococcus sp. Minos11]